MLKEISDKGLLCFQLRGAVMSPHGEMRLFNFITESLSKKYQLYGSVSYLNEKKILLGEKCLIL